MKNNQAFSLLELLITLAIISIIIAIAYPNYTTHIMKTRRTQAKVTLVDLAAKLEHYYGINHTYQGATLSDLNFNNDHKFYHYQLQTNADGFILFAIPRNSQAKDECGSLNYNEMGEKKISGNRSIDMCW